MVDTSVFKILIFDIFKRTKWVLSVFWGAEDETHAELSINPRRWLAANESGTWTPSRSISRYKSRNTIKNFFEKTMFEKTENMKKSKSRECIYILSKLQYFWFGGKKPPKAQKSGPKSSKIHNFPQERQTDQHGNQYTTHSNEYQPVVIKRTQPQVFIKETKPAQSYSIDNRVSIVRGSQLWWPFLKNRTRNKSSSHLLVDFCPHSFLLLFRGYETQLKDEKKVTRWRNWGFTI